MTTKTEKLLKLLDAETKSVGGFERALYCLLKCHEAKLPEVDGYFHKALRQVDVTDSGLTDAAIWLMLDASVIFWDCFEKVSKEL